DDKWTQQAKFTSDDSSDAEDQFGVSVSLDGDTAIVGCPGEDSYRGSVYIFVRSANGTWIRQAKITEEYRGLYYYFGRSVSLDGNKVLIGADSGDSFGAAYIFVRSIDGTWTQEAQLTASDWAAGDSFGDSVSLDGDTALIGTWHDNDNGHDSGSAYIFVRTENGMWTEQQKLTADDGAYRERFGSHVSLHGNIAMIAAMRDDAFGSNAGSVYIFSRVGNIWKQQQKINPEDGAAEDRFSAIAQDGHTALVGAPGKDSYRGAAYFFTRGHANMAPMYKLLFLK
ncbi:MAG: hypothetical protein D3906_03560, partial [Candidatus Electrothrix sp. AUS1_2]|nr:hypothetical protein [Candidatus Electrothrix sp. AUS1_2]